MDFPCPVFRVFHILRGQPQLTLTMRFDAGQLTTQLTGRPIFPVFPESETKFFLKVVDAQIEFFTNADGAVTHLVLHQAGRQIKGLRQ